MASATYDNDPERGRTVGPITGTLMPLAASARSGMRSLGAPERQSRWSPRATHSIQELARKHAPEAVETLADISKNGTPGARVSAAIALLDRAYGKPPAFAPSDTQAFQRAIDMTDDELAAIASRATLHVVK